MGPDGRHPRSSARIGAITAESTFAPNKVGASGLSSTDELFESKRLHGEARATVTSQTYRTAEQHEPSSDGGPKIRVAFVMEQSLGNVTHYLNLRAAEDVAPWLQATWLPIEYRASRAPWAVAGSIDARRALVRVNHEIDAVFVHTSTIGLLAPVASRSRPFVLSTDGTPDKSGMREMYNLKPQRRLAGPLKGYLYRQVFRRAAGFVAWSEWTKAALVDDYGLDADRVAVITPGVDVRAFAPGKRENDLPRILFVGGDFHRKGGDLLLEVFRKRLQGRAELALVTTEDVPAQPGVTVYNRLGANSPVLRDLYATSDLFVLPTRSDMMSLASTEALSSGLPIVVTRIGGVGELVTDGETGRLIDVDDAQQLGDAVEELVTDVALRLQMSARARIDATARFDARINARRLFEFVRSVT